MVSVLRFSKVLCTMIKSEQLQMEADIFRIFFYPQDEEKEAVAAQTWTREIALSVPQTEHLRAKSPPASTHSVPTSENNAGVCSARRGFCRPKAMDHLEPERHWKEGGGCEAAAKQGLRCYSNALAFRSTWRVLRLRSGAQG